MQVDSISGLQAFVAAAEARSFRQAAQALGISSSAVGKAVARLEDQLGAQLFHRTTRTISLTGPGAMFLRRAKLALEELADAERELAHAAAAPRGRLRVGLPISGSVLTGPLAQFMALYPQVELDLDISDRLVDVVEEGFDVVIRTGTPADNRLVHRRLGHFTGTGRIASIPAGAGTPAIAADLVGHACLRQRASTGRLMPWPMTHSDLSVPTTLIASVIDPLLDLALAGAGIAAFPHFVIERQLGDGRLTPVLEGVLVNDGVLNILWPSSRHQTPKTRAFVDHMLAGQATG